MIKLICLDMDGVLVVPNNLWMELHRKYGTYEEGKRVTDLYLRTDYDRLVEEVFERLWKGKPDGPYWELVEAIPFSTGIEEFFQEIDRFDAKRAIVSGGSWDIAEKVQKRFRIDFIYANRILFKDGKIDGREHFHSLMGEGTEAKAQVVRDLCKELKISPEEVLYIGDSMIDIKAFREVGTSIAFNTKYEELKKEATFVVDSDDLRDVVPLLADIRSQEQIHQQEGARGDA